MFRTKPVVEQNIKVMSSLKNRVLLLGNLGKDPEIRNLENGKKVTRFTLATTEEYKNSDGKKVKETTWHNIVAWNGTADIAARYLKKGGQVAVEGRLAYRSYEDKGGVNRNITEVVIHDILFLKSGKEEVQVRGE